MTEPPVTLGAPEVPVAPRAHSAGLRNLNILLLFINLALVVTQSMNYLHNYEEWRVQKTKFDRQNKEWQASYDEWQKCHNAMKGIPDPEPVQE